MVLLLENIYFIVEMIVFDRETTSTKKFASITEREF